MPVGAVPSVLPTPPDARRATRPPGGVPTAILADARGPGHRIGTPLSGVRARRPEPPQVADLATLTSGKGVPWD